MFPKKYKKKWKKCLKKVSKKVLKKCRVTAEILPDVETQEGRQGLALPLCETQLRDSAVLGNILVQLISIHWQQKQLKNAKFITPQRIKCVK